MTTVTAHGPLAPATATAPRAGRLDRVLALVKAEVLLLVRNRTTLFNAVALAPLMVVFLSTVGMVPEGADSAVAGLLLTALVALALLFVVYYNLTTTLVARREELVLKRLLTGDVSRAEVVLACATPAVLVVLAQIVLGVAATAVWFELPTVQNPLWIVLAVAGGTILFALLAAASSGFTRTVEAAQLSTLPVLMVATALSGLALPLHLMPGAVEQVAQWSPLYPVVALLQHGFGAVAPDGTVASGALGDVAQPVAAMAVWIALGVLAATRWMRWEPRR